MLTLACHWGEAAWSAWLRDHGASATMPGVIGLLGSALPISFVALPTFRATENSWLIPIGDQLA